MRIVSGYRPGLGIENAGEYIVLPNEWPKSSKADHIRNTLSEMQKIEPSLGWKLQSRGTQSDWHDCV